MDKLDVQKIVDNAETILTCKFNKEENDLFNKQIDRATQLCAHLVNMAYIANQTYSVYDGPAAHWALLSSIEGKLFYSNLLHLNVYLILSQTPKYRIGISIGTDQHCRLFTDIFAPKEDKKVEVIGLNDEETQAGIDLLERDTKKNLQGVVNKFPFTLEEINALESKNRVAYLVKFGPSDEDCAHGSIYLSNNLSKTEYFINRFSKTLSAICKKIININIVAKIVKQNRENVAKFIELDPHKSNFSNYRKILRYAKQNKEFKDNSRAIDDTDITDKLMVDVNPPKIVPKYLIPTMKKENLQFKIDRHHEKFVRSIIKDNEFYKYIKESTDKLSDKKPNDIAQEIGITFKKPPKNLRLYYIYDVKEVKRTEASNVRLATITSYDGSFCTIHSVADDSPLYPCIDKGNLIIQHSEEDVAIISRITNKDKILNNATRIVNAIKNTPINNTKHSFIDQYKSEIKWPKGANYDFHYANKITHTLRKRLAIPFSNILLLNSEELDNLILANIRLGANVEVAQKEQAKIIEDTQRTTIDSFYLGLIRLAVSKKPFNIAPFGGNRAIEFTEDSVSYQGNVLKADIIKTVFPIEEKEYNLTNAFNQLFPIPDKVVPTYSKLYGTAFAKKILKKDISKCKIVPETITLNGIQHKVSSYFFIGSYRDVSTEFPDPTGLNETITQPIELDFNTILVRFVNVLCNSCYRIVLSNLYDVNLDTKVKLTEATIGNINIVIEYHRKSGRFYINGKAIRKVELNPVLMKANCFTEQKAYNKYVANIASTSVRSRELINNGLELTLVANNKNKNPIIFFEFEKNSREWTLILRNSENKVLEKHPIMNGIGKFNKYITYRARNNRIGVRSNQTINAAAFSELLTDIPTFNENSLLKCLAIGTSLIDSRLARSRKLLEDTVKVLKSEYLTDLGPAKISGYKVKGSSGTEYLVACSKVTENPNLHGGSSEFGSVYVLPQLEYVCIVDKSDEQSGYDMIVNRLYALANDKLIVGAVTTLRHHAKGE